MSSVQSALKTTMDQNLFNSLMQQSTSSYNISATQSSINQHLLIYPQNVLQNNSTSSCQPKRKAPQQKHIEAEVITKEEHDLNIKNSPAYYLAYFIDNCVISWFMNEINSQNLNLKNFQPVTEEEIRCFIGILYLSGYVDVPRRRMLWERMPDTHNTLVSNAMQRDRFETIFSALNLTDDLNLKLRPLIDLLNDRFLRFSPKDDHHSIAECTLFLNKQKSNKNLKIWCGCTKNGYCVWLEPNLTQNSDKINQLYFGKTIIINYANIIQRYRPSLYNLLYENTYTDMSVNSELQKLRIQPSSSDRDKNGCILNPPLGGVDRLEASINLYRISLRGKKNYSALISYCLDLALCNAWQLYKLSNDKKQQDLLSFRRNIVIYYLQHYAKPILGYRGGRPAKVRLRGKRAPISDARFDGIRHYVISQEKQTRCAKCSAKTTTRCQKCDVGVHVKCFVDYHQKPKGISTSNCV